MVGLYSEPRLNDAPLAQVNNYLPVFLGEMEIIRRLLLKLMIPIVGIAALYVVWMKTPGHFVREIDKTRLALARYYQINGRFPGAIAGMDLKLAGAEDEISRDLKASHWYYGGRQDRYTLSRHTFFRTSIKFAFDCDHEEQSGWFLAEGNGLASKMPQFPLLDNEKSLFKESKDVR